MNTPQHTKKPDTGAASGREERLVRACVGDTITCCLKTQPRTLKVILVNEFDVEAANEFLNEQHPRWELIANVKDIGGED